MATETRTDSGVGSLADEQLAEALRLMLTIRLFDERALALYRAGEMRGTTHPYIGMEAVGVGVTLALRRTTTSPAPTAATATGSPRVATRAR